MYDTANFIHCGTEALLAQASSCLRGIVSAARALNSCTLYLRNSTACRGSTEIRRGKVLPWHHIHMLISNSRISPVPTVGAWFCRSFLSYRTPEAVLNRVDWVSVQVAWNQWHTSKNVRPAQFEISKYQTPDKIKFTMSCTISTISKQYRLHRTN